jgi:hypothetical protein
MLAIVVEVYDVFMDRFSDTDSLVHIHVNMTAPTRGGAMLFAARRDAKSDQRAV